MGVLLISIWGALTALVCWVRYCNRKTFEQQMEIANRVFSSPDWREKAKVMDSVSYEKHLLALVLFRNPAKLYKWGPDHV